MCVTPFACSSTLWAFCLNLFHLVKCRWSSCLVCRFEFLFLGQWSGPWMLYTLCCILWCQFVTFSFVNLVDFLGSIVSPSQVFSMSSSCLVEVGHFGSFILHFTYYMLWLFKLAQISHLGALSFLKNLKKWRKTFYTFAFSCI